MADFALLACAYAEHAGIGADTMMATIMDNAVRQIQAVIEPEHGARVEKLRLRSAKP